MNGNNQDQPVTKRELDAALKVFKQELKDELIEAMREMQTQILRGFEFLPRGTNPGCAR